MTWRRLVVILALMIGVAGTAGAQDSALVDFDFDDGSVPDVMEATEGWQVHEQYGIATLRAESEEYEFASIPSGVAWTDYTLEIQVRIVRGGLALDVRLPENFCGGYSATFLTDEETFKLYEVDRHCTFHLLETVDFTFPADDWTMVRFEAVGSQLTVRVDDAILFETTDDTFASGFVMLTAYPDSEILVERWRVEAIAPDD
jgi:hypothetical protein